MFLFREHRGSLFDSMQTVREMSTFSELKDHVENIYGSGEIVIKDYCYDERIKWDTHIVCLDDRAIGFTNRHVETKLEQSQNNS